jgi:uncharacterized membrane protein YtjA (UPF0391 family)
VRPNAFNPPPLRREPGSHEPGRRNSLRARRLSNAVGSGATHLLEDTMLKWALIFLVISIVAGALGFTGISQASAGIARILFFIFIVIFVILLILGLMAGEALF